jgi:hypothetical protein
MNQVTMTAELEEGEISDGAGTPQPAQMSSFDRGAHRFLHNTEPREAQVSS